MQEVIKCSKCNYVVADLNSRYCKKCGNLLWITLDSEKIKGKSLTDILNSVYNLLTDKTNPDRWKFIDKRSDDAIWKRAKLMYGDSINLPLGMLFSNMDNFQTNSEHIYQMSACDALSGYSVRVTEELFSGKKSFKMNLSDAEGMTDRYMGEQKKGGFLYQNVDIQDPNIKRIIFSEALGSYCQFTNFILIDKAEMLPFIASVQRQNVKIETNRKKDEVIADFNFGYFLRVSESLMPYSNGITGLFEKMRMSKEEYEKMIKAIDGKFENLGKGEKAEYTPEEWDILLDMCSEINKKLDKENESK